MRHDLRHALRQTFTRESITAPHPSRPVPWLPWIASALFLLGLLAVAATLVAVTLRSEDEGLLIRVVEAESATALEGVEVQVGGETLVTDGDGYVTLPDRDATVDITVQHAGYRAQAGSIGEARTGAMTVELRPSGVADDPAVGAASTGDAVQAVTTGDTSVTDPVAVRTDDAADATSGGAASDTSGNDVAAAFPTTASSTPAGGGITEPAGDSPTPAPAQGSVDTFAGTVRDIDGQPVQGAIVTDGANVVITGADGVFGFAMAGVTAESLRVFAPGYGERLVPTTEVSAQADLTLERQDVKAIYYNPHISDTPEDVNRLIEIINTTEVNALVIDIKEELIFYDSHVEFFRNAGTVRPTFDLAALLARLEEDDIYTIARLVVFKDSIVAETYPDLAVMSTATGQPWRDMNGVAWVNPMLHALWDANIELAVEAANLGFDEIQYDYVRFPTDGDLSTMEFGLEYNEANRVLAISSFLERSRQALLPTGAKLAADVFGYTMLVSDDLGIGQDLTELAPHLDYLNPMVYPSHFPDGSLALDGHPNNFPYETIEISMRNGREQLGSATQLRPWLQDFDYWDMIPYGPEEVRAQIQACEDVGTSGWMLWDPNNQYTVEALGPDDGNMGRFEQAALTEAYLTTGNEVRTTGRPQRRPQSGLTGSKQTKKSLSFRAQRRIPARSALHQRRVRNVVLQAISHGVYLMCFARRFFAAL